MGVGVIEIRVGDALTLLRDMPDSSIHCCVTSPPYWGLRDYGVDGQIGLEGTPEEYTAKMVEVFREVRRVLRDDGTLWLNLGDSYYATASSCSGRSSGLEGGKKHQEEAVKRPTKIAPGLKPKDLIGIPWRVAFALQADGWWLRSDIVWNKPNPMPESVKDRPTRSHEYIFLMSKSAQYFYDADAIREPYMESSIKWISQPSFDTQTGGPKDYGPDSNRSMRKTLENFKRKTDKQRGHSRKHAGFNDRWDSMTKTEQSECGRNKRDVWTVPTHPYPGAHFATFPTKLIEPCILAGCPEGGTVLDPFSGAGTTGLVASRLDREFIGIELKPKYAEMARERIRMDAPLFYGAGK
jgi:DNA modification methylase